MENPNTLEYQDDAALAYDNPDKVTWQQMTTKYFHGGYWGQSLNLLQRLCQYSNQGVIVTGAKGIGKTTLCQAFIETQSNHCHCCRIEADPSENLDSVFQQIAEGFGIVWQRYSEKFDADSLRAAAALDTRNWVLLIDDAELLTDDVLLELANLTAAIPQSGTSQLSATHKLHLVLFGDTELETRLADLGLRQLLIDNFQIITLESLAAAEIGSYLQHKWHLAGNTTQLPFDQKILKKIWQLSLGVPSEVERLAKSFLAGENLVKHKYNKINLPLWQNELKLPVLLGITVLAGLVCWLILALITGQDQSADKDGGSTLPLIAQQANKIQDDKIAATLAKPALIPAETATNSAIAEATPTLSTPETVARSNQTLATKPDTASKLPEHHDVKLVPKQHTETNTSTANTSTDNTLTDSEIEAARLNLITQQQKLKQQPQITTAQTTPAVSAATAAPIDMPTNQTTIASKTQIIRSEHTEHSDHAANVVSSHEANILAVPGNHYTLQLLGAANPQGIEKFIKEYKLTAKAHYYRTILKGEPWHILIYGNYASYNEAKQALAKLPAELKKLNPWPRTFASVQQVLQQQN